MAACCSNVVAMLTVTSNIELSSTACKRSRTSERNKSTDMRENVHMRKAYALPIFQPTSSADLGARVDNQNGAIALLKQNLPGLHCFEGLSGRRSTRHGPRGIVSLFIDKSGGNLHPLPSQYNSGAGDPSHCGGSPQINRRQRRRGDM